MTNELEAPTLDLEATAAAADTLSDALAESDKETLAALSAENLQLAHELIKWRDQATIRERDLTAAGRSMAGFKAELTKTKKALAAAERTLGQVTPSHRLAVGWFAAGTAFGMAAAAALMVLM